MMKGCSGTWYNLCLFERTRKRHPRLTCAQKVPYNVEIPRNGIIDAQIPGWGVGELVAVVSALVISETNVTMPAVSSPYIPSQSGYISLVVDHKSLSDITIQVTSTGHLNATFPQPTSGIGYRIFAYYQKRTLNKNLKFENNQTATIWDNGSYIVDHYSAAGAQTVIKFWEEYILIDGLKEMLMEVGHYGIYMVKPKCITRFANDIV